MEGRQDADDPKMEVSGEVFGRMTLMAFMFLAPQVDTRNNFKCSTAQWDDNTTGKN